MNFLTPAFLMGLPLVAVPVVIHLLSRRQQKKISWGAMRFLMQAATRKRRIWKLTDLLLLLLRTAAFLFFIGALARPLLPSHWLGGSIPREVILVIDQSMSMTRRVDGTTFFDLQLQKASALLDALTTSDSVRVLLAGESPQWLTDDAVEVNPLAVRKLAAQIEKLKPTSGAADLIAAVREAADIEPPKSKSARVIVVISDGQRFGWRLEERPLWAAVQARIQNAGIPTSVSLQLLGAPGEATGNVSVNSIETVRPFAAMNQSLNFSAVIQNFGSRPSAATLLSWRADDENIGASTVPELAPGASTRVTVSHSFPAAGVSRLGCELGLVDDLAADNQASLLVRVFDRLPILVVGHERANDFIESDTRFVLAALGAGSGSSKSWRSVFEPTVIAASQLGGTDLNQFRCVILADVPRLEPAALEKLERYATEGGGVWIALGAGSDEAFFNQSIHRSGAGLAPFRLNGAKGDPNDREKFVSVRAASDSHPATVLLADSQRLDLDRARIYRRHLFDPFSGRDVSVLLQAEGGEPVVVERKFGRGRVLVQSVPLGVSWSTLPLCQAYVAMLHEWLWYLSEANLPRHNLAVGETLLATASNQNSVATLTLPDGADLELNATPAASGPQFRYASTRIPGEYRLQVKDAAASAARFQVLRTAQESDLTAWSDENREQLAAMKEFQFADGLSDVATMSNVEAPKHPLEGWLLIALACVLLGEVLLAGWTTHRRNLRVKPVTMG